MAKYTVIRTNTADSLIQAGLFKYYTWPVKHYLYFEFIP